MFFDFAIQPRTTLKCRILDLIFRVITLAYNSSPHTLLKEFFKLKIIKHLKRVVGSEWMKKTKYSFGYVRLGKPIYPIVDICNQ